MPSPFAPQDPAADAPDQVAVTITKEADGTFTVAPETDEESTAPETPGMESDEEKQSQTAATIDEALDMARTMLEGGDAMDPMAAAKKGYASKQTKPMSAPNPAGIFGG